MLRGAALALTVTLAVASPARAAPGWVTPGTMLSSAATSAASPNVVLTPGGEAIAAWVRSGVVEVSVRPPGGQFGAPQAVSFAGADAESAPELAVSAKDGRVLLTWRDQCTSNANTCVVEAVLRNPGDAFGAPVSLSGRGAGAPRGAFTSDGRAVVAWERQSAIEAAVSKAGGGFSGPGAVVDSSPVDVQSPDVATDAAGRAYLVWAVATPGASSSLYDAVLRLAVLSPGAGSFSAPTDLWSQDSTFDQASGTSDSVSYGSLAIAVDPAGNGAAVWLRFLFHSEPGLQTLSTAVQALPFGVGGARSSPQNLDGAILIFSPPGASGVGTTLAPPAIATTPAGAMAAAWTKRDSSSSTTWVQVAARPAGQTRFGDASSFASGSSGPSGLAAGSATVVPVGQGSIMLGFIQGTVVRAALAQGGGAFGTPAAISAAGAGLSVPRFAGDADGDAIGAWSQLDGGVYRTQAATYDATPPELRSVQVPATAITGQTVTFAVSPFDTFSDVGASWTFGDGRQGESGNSVSHVFTHRGDYTVTVTAADGVGNTTSATRRIAVADPDHHAPKITALRLTRTRFAIAPRATAVSAARTRRGTTIRFTLSERATVRLYIKRVLLGHRSGRRCSTKTAAGARCSVYRGAGKLVRVLRRGRRKVAFTGRVGTRPLRPGRYRLSVIAKDGAGNTSKPARARFTIIRG